MSTVSTEGDSSAILRESPYPSGVEALKAHLEYGVRYNGFKELTFRNLCRWLTSLLTENDYVVFPVIELVFRSHFAVRGTTPSGEALYGIRKGVSSSEIILTLCGAGISLPQAEQAYTTSINKLAEAGLVECYCTHSKLKPRRHWKRDIPGLSRRKVAFTAAVNPRNLSFDGLIDQVRKIE